MAELDWAVLTKRLESLLPVYRPLAQNLLLTRLNKTGELLINDTNNSLIGYTIQDRHESAQINMMRAYLFEELLVSIRKALPAQDQLQDVRQTRQTARRKHHQKLKRTKRSRYAR